MSNEQVVGVKPEVSTGINRQNVRFVILAQGQGGASIGQVLAANLPNKPYLIAINTSNQDLDQLNLPDSQKFKIGGESADGAGKNRNKAKAYFKNFRAKHANSDKTYDAFATLMGYYEEVFFHPTMQTIIITVFTSDGGTGSGIGPMNTASLANYMNSVKSFHIGNTEYTIDDVMNSVPRPVVIGLTTKCRADSGATNLQNTIECFSDIQRSIDAGLGNFFIADNNLDPSINYNSTEEMYKIINARIAAPLLKFLGIEMNSNIKCMDLQDKINTLRISGCSSFVSISDKNNYQYIDPKGQSVMRTVMMLRHNLENPGEEEQKALQLIKKLNVTSVDTTPVFFDTSKSGLSSDSVAKDLLDQSMLGFFGFKSLNAIVEDLRENLHRIRIENDKKRDVIINNSTGFSSIKEDSEDLNERFGAKSIDQSSVIDLF